MDLDVTIENLESVKAQIDDLTKQKKLLEEQIGEAVSKDIANQLSHKDYGCGTANIFTEKYKIKAVVSKKVTWDTESLKDVARVLAGRGEQPYDYIDAKLTVSEKKYDKLNEVDKALFNEARTVEPSAPKITVEKKD